ncbi:GTP-binding protein [Aestuariibaculum lutulentum]|uniref:GTP-binding protein n=1 Tax=Aestuariibaculum lutulentum TaxID=2920935 RepID=A0ABS9RPG8_9FLAO|nr:GTP-binding protein [Aestuariibaculum lutulentum]MCH4554037.1 GTP-binding protein [Aestuariibaculum lutulentum]
MSTTNDIILRPRFKFEKPEKHQVLLQLFKDAKTNQSDFIIVVVDGHVFIKYPKHKQHFWSPQLHLEINEITNDTSEVKGLFGPNPTVWTFFMFVHFFLAGTFIALGIWAYSNWVIKTSVFPQLSGMAIIIVAWIGLYIAGTFGKISSKEDMLALKDFMNKTLNQNYF